MARDKFDKELAERMHSVEMQPDDAVWDRIESSLDATPLYVPVSNRRRAMRIVATITSAAAILIVSLLLINKQEDSSTQPITLSANEFIEQEPIPEITPIKTETPLLASAPKRLPKRAERKLQVERIEKPIGDSSHEEPLKNESPEEAQPQQVRKTRGSVERNVQRVNFQPFVEKQKGKRGGWMMSVSGSGNFNSSSSITGNNSLVRPLKEINPNNGITLFAPKNHDREWTHNMPLSASVTVQKMFTKKIGLETGLTYTYLSSSSKGEMILDQDIKQRLNYLGIPLSVVYSITEGKRFGVYAKAGFLVDKAISATGTSRIADTSQSIDIDTKGVQFSATVQVGASYNLTNFMSLYLEPTANYYFKSNQPISYRTENDFGFTAMVGLRFKLK